MKMFKVSVLSVILGLGSMHAQAQSEKKQFSLQKGQVLDVLFVSTRVGAEDLQKEYFQTVFPLASKLGYHRLPGFPIANVPLQGNYHPEFLALAYWDDLDTRSSAMATIEQEVPDFHDRRKAIWTSFNITYFELQEDVSFEIEEHKYYVVSAYWEEDKGAFKQFQKNWLKGCKSAGGQTQLVLTNGESPYRYYHNPDFLAITAWDSQAAFEAFNEMNHKMGHKGALRVNEFHVQ